MNIENQKTFGWLVAVDIFLGGAGAGLFLVSFLMDVLNHYVALARIGVIVGPALVITGTVLLFVDLKNRIRFYRLVSNSSSWVARGTWGIAAFILFGLGYSIPTQLNPQLSTTASFFAIGLVAAISSVLVMVYTGFLFSASRRIPFWNTPILPLLFLFSSLYTGMAVFLLIGTLNSRAIEETFQAAVIVELLLILINLFILGFFLKLAFVAGSTTAQSARLLLKSISFIIFVVIAGMIVPLGFFVYQLFLLHNYNLTLTSSLLVLLGGLFLRQGILKSGIRLSFVPELQKRINNQQRNKSIAIN